MASMIKKWGKFAGASIVTVFLTIMLLSSGVDAATATDQLKETLNKLIKVLNEPSLKAPDKDKERREVLHRLLEERFDEKRLAEKTLGKHWRNRTEDEKREFIDIFSDLLERTYLKEFDTYLTEAGSISTDNILYIKETVKGRYAIVETKVVSGGDSEMPIHYRLINEKGSWLICDISIEGVIITKNYRAQFYEMLADMSFKELIDKLKAKMKNEGER